MNLLNRLSLIILIPALLFAVSCSVSDSNSGGEKQVAVKMKLNQMSTATAKQISSSPTIQSVDSLTEVKLLVEELELESTMDEDSLDFEVDDFVVNLPLDGSEIELSSANVPAGVYDEFKMEIEHDDDTNVNDPDFINESGDDDGYTIVIKGVYNGEDFMYRSQEDFEIEMEFNPPFEINDSSSPSIAINIDPSGWFKDSSGNDLDPTDPANQEQIDENIENSFDVEEEEDDDDDDDSDDDDSDDDDN
ncbi:hypothetical protein [Fodinibius sp.]|uniref:hypothetical protein n=1 Tax=Fodinibius sp. TaxID=1872440 RepID=UPI002ACEA10B|nr:hypothetical protein [Fodinibius sp.]MDZ7657764.1 hypothetical protein [Fodinibius sp.]